MSDTRSNPSPRPVGRAAAFGVIAASTMLLAGCGGGSASGSGSGNAERLLLSGRTSMSRSPSLRVGTRSSTAAIPAHRRWSPPSLAWEARS